MWSKYREGQTEIILACLVIWDCKVVLLLFRYFSTLLTITPKNLYWSSLSVLWYLFWWVVHHNHFKNRLQFISFLFHWSMFCLLWTVHCLVCSSLYVAWLTFGLPIITRIEPFTDLTFAASVTYARQGVGKNIVPT